MLCSGLMLLIVMCQNVYGALSSSSDIGFELLENNEDITKGGEGLIKPQVGLLKAIKLANILTS